MAIICLIKDTNCHELSINYMSNYMAIICLIKDTNCHELSINYMCNYY